MSWFKRNTKRKRGRPKRQPSRLTTLAAAVRGIGGYTVVRYLWIAPLIAGAAWGVGWLEDYVRARPEFLAPPTIHLANAPDGLEDSIRSVIDPVIQVGWNEPNLCKDIGQALERSAWVRRVRQIRRYADGSVIVSADYRTPAALVQSGGEFYLLADDGVRLPGRYGYDASLVVVQGTVAGVPGQGERWAGRDVSAALEVIRLLRDMPFFDQVTGVLVGNYDGRRDNREPHIVLATAPAGSRIVWGSAPGEEIEENFPEDKIRILWENFRRWGRIDAGNDTIDVSTFPDRFTIPART